MPNLATALKEEIGRLARKESRTGMDALKKSSALQRREIAALKRRLQTLEGQLRRLAKVDGRSVAQTAEGGEESSMRWRPDGFKKHRARLGLSAADMGRLLGCNGQSVYKWEEGKARPRAAQLARIAEVRKLGKREAWARLEAPAGK